MTPARPAASPGRSAALIAVAVLAAFTANIDLSIVNLALPTIGRAFGVGQSTLAWTVNAYVLPYAVSILAVGRLGDGFGHRRVLAVGALVFAGGSIVSGLAGSYEILLLGRVAQGVGGAALLTIGLAAISAGFQGAERGRALGLYFAAGATASVIGPIVGGVLTSAFGWSGMFWCQVPLSLAVAVAARVAVPGRAAGRRRSLDLPALALGSIVLLGVNGSLLQAHGWGWTSIGVVGGFGLAVVALAGFVLRERRTPEPAVRLEVLRSRAFVASTLVGASAWFGILSGTVQLAIYLQEIRGLSTTEAALVLTPWPLIAAVLFPRASGIVTRIGTGRTMTGSLVLALVAALLMTTFDAATPLVVVSAVAALGGVPIALGVVASTMTALSEFSPADAGIAAGVFNALRQVGSALGVAIPAAVFDLAVGPGADLLPGSHAAFASRAVVFGLGLILVWSLLRRTSTEAASATEPGAVPATER